MTKSALIVVEMIGPVNMLACQLCSNLGRKISASGNDREGDFLYQTVSVLVQRYNTVLLQILCCYYSFSHFYEML